MFHNSLDINNVTELRLRTLVYFGCGAIRKIEEIAAALEKRGIGKLLVVTGRGAYKKTGAWDQIVPALAAHKIDYALFDKVTPIQRTAWAPASFASATASSICVVVGFGVTLSKSA